MRIVSTGFALFFCSSLLACSSLSRPEEIAILPEPPTPVAAKPPAPARTRPAAQAAQAPAAGCGE